MVDVSHMKNETRRGYAPLHVIGLGPGDSAFLAPEALRCLEESRVIAGYSGYIAQLSEDLLAGKRRISTGMRAEVQRVEAALDSALAGEITSLVCSGDPGVYAMSGLVLERLEKRGPSCASLPVHIVPGIPAVCAAAALLGAPLMHDFACVSLSDLLTPWEIITRRLECALAGDFVLAIYNPRSSKRTRQLEEALALALRHRGGSTPVGVVRNACRPEQRCAIVPLADLRTESVDMFTLLIVGNSASRIIPGSGAEPFAWEYGARMLTPRGYSNKY